MLISQTNRNTSKVHSIDLYVSENLEPKKYHRPEITRHVLKNLPGFITVIRSAAANPLASRWQTRSAPVVKANIDQSPIVSMVFFQDLWTNHVRR